MSATLREDLGIPANAQRVLVFVESSHWDTNWLQTSEEYFKNRLEPIFAAVLDELERDPKRIYCIESVFFLKLYWERRPEHRPALRRLLDNRQLRIMTSSLTTPDTLLPHVEAIFRDFHLGQTWLRDHGFEHIHPNTAYFPDNFGHSPHLPSLMAALGIQHVGITRIDGMHFVGSDWRPKSAFPLHGSTAALLEKEHRTLDFVWRDDAGSEILCHWNAFTYFQGDMLGHVGIIRWMGKLFGARWRTCSHIARQVKGFAKQLAPLSRTPYLLCPIGMDFNEPIHDLGGLLARYNDVHFGKTGTFAVLAGFDDYFALVEAHRAQLPTLSVDPNPYWTGFYATRPSLKQRPRRVVRSLLAAEKIATFSPKDEERDALLHDVWTHVALINHHDAITGTSPDRVFRGEQEPWMERAEASLDRATESLHRPSPPPRSSRTTVFPIGTSRSRTASWHREGDALFVETSHCQLTFSEARGGCLTNLVMHGEELLNGLGFDLISHLDDGGLWRLGHEYAGGRFQERARTSQSPATLEVIAGEDDGSLSVVATSVLCGRAFKRILTTCAAAPFVRLRVEGSPARRTTITCRFDVSYDTSSFSMNTVGGSISRPSARLYSPTFWPVPSIATLSGEARSMHVCFEAPTAVSVRDGEENRSLEWIVARNAPKERAFLLLPVLAHPTGGTSDELQTHDAALFTTSRETAPDAVQECIERAWLPLAWRHLHEEADDLFECDDGGVSVLAAKRADRGTGFIVRLLVSNADGRVVGLRPRAHDVQAACLCDARERDIEPLRVESGTSFVPLRSRMLTVRLVAVRSETHTAALST